MEKLEKVMLEVDEAATVIPGNDVGAIAGEPLEVGQWAEIRKDGAYRCTALYPGINGGVVVQSRREGEVWRAGSQRVVIRLFDHA